MISRRLRQLIVLGNFLIFMMGAFAMPAWSLSPQKFEISEAHNRFGFKIFSALHGAAFQPGKKPQNIFISPASLAWALEMLLNGAQGATLQGMLATLELAGISPEVINAANQSVTQSLQQADPKVELAIANSLWGKAGIQFLPAFLALSEKFYAAKLGVLESAATINAWVSEKTRGKIPTIIRQENILPNTVLVLINALYFKGLWEKPFDKAKTAPLPFTGLDGAAKPHPMMSRSGKFTYFEDANLQAIRLPYGNGRIGFYAVLPKASSNLTTFLGTLDAARWKELIRKMSPRPGTIVLPRFKTEYGEELSKQLSDLGMGIAFTRQADFGKVATLPPDLWLQISIVQHKTFVEVNEEGTEAAAVTAVSMLAGSAPPPPEQPFTMIVDRPFVSVIQDSQTGTILFLGAIVDPQN